MVIRQVGPRARGGPRALRGGAPSPERKADRAGQTAGADVRRRIARVNERQAERAAVLGPFANARPSRSSTAPGPPTRGGDPA
jgi:hypothetical protein